MWLQGTRRRCRAHVQRPATTCTRVRRASTSGKDDSQTRTSVRLTRHPGGMPSPSAPLPARVTATVEDLTPEAVRAYRDALERAYRTPATIAKHLSAIRGLAAAVGAMPTCERSGRPASHAASRAPCRTRSWGAVNEAVTRGNVAAKRSPRRALERRNGLVTLIHAQRVLEPTGVRHAARVGYGQSSCSASSVGPSSIRALRCTG
jgi:hypothetical protein